MSGEFFPEEISHQVQRPANKLRSPAVLIALGAMVVGAGGYSIHEHNVAKAAEAQNAAMMASLKTTNAQVEQLTAKLNELTVPKPSPEIPVHHRVTKRLPEPRVKRAVHRRAEDPRWKKFQSQLDDQGRAIESTGKILPQRKSSLTTPSPGTMPK